MKLRLLLVTTLFAASALAAPRPVVSNVAKAEYNLAVALAEARLSSETLCEVGAYQSTILQHVTNAASLDPSLTRRAQQNKALQQALGNNIAFMELLGDKDLATNLGRAVFYGMAKGVYGYDLKLSFHLGGLVKIHRATWDEKKSTMVWSKTNGAWTLEKSAHPVDLGIVTITEGGKSTRYLLKEGYNNGIEHQLVNLEDESDILFNQVTGECDA